VVNELAIQVQKTLGMEEFDYVVVQHYQAGQVREEMMGGGEGEEAGIPSSIVAVWISSTL